VTKESIRPVRMNTFDNSESLNSPRPFRTTV
jgi:hypothetical protein